ncbi:hypothetical protein [Roseburia sp. 831b]|uniref:hypothetical protein n=1 Tax=Roseburia sp. 831b TaxID=1261635 RepID=UPI0013566ABB|nr:hypothetical protein [Roseburia sp. 831b]WVK73768.1 hypothetical protein BIV16_04440 [Roseburia sp. 831b]
MQLDIDFSDLDDFLDELNTFNIDCPECNSPLEISLSDMGKVIKCPHCNIDIEIESE